MTNLALWKKSIGEARWLFVSCAVFMFLVHWLRVYIASFFVTGKLETLLTLLPEPVQPLLPVTYAQMAAPAGRIAAEYDDPVVLLLMTVWAISRGSDAVSGELNRGTMEMLLGQPVTRLGVISVQACVTLLGAALIAVAAWLGTCVGLATVSLDGAPAAKTFIPPAINLFALGAFLAGLTTMISAPMNYRARTIGVVGGFYAVSMVVKIVGRMVPGLHWLAYTTFFTAFEPQWLVGESQAAWKLWIPKGSDAWTLGGLGYDAVLVGLGLAAYLVASVIFYRRDLPAPL